jgi:hypothetical protein
MMATPVETMSMLQALESITRHLSTTNTLGAVLDFVKPTATTALRERRLFTRALMKGDTVGSIALICATSDTPKTAANIHPRLGRGKLADLVDSQPLTVSSRSSCLGSLLKAKSNLRLLHDRIPGHRYRIMRARTTAVTHPHHQILHLQVSLTPKLDH